MEKNNFTKEDQSQKKAEFKTMNINAQFQNFNNFQSVYHNQEAY